MSVIHESLIYIGLAFKVDTMDSKIWYNGEIKDYDKVKVPLLTHSLQYGSGVFEGIRAYETEKGAAIFRLKKHVERFVNSAKIYRLDLKHSADEISRAIVDVVKINGLKSCYIRPFAFFSSDAIGLSTTGKETAVCVAAVPFGQYFGDKAQKGVRCKISSWRRINSDILPILAKASGNYLNSVIASNEAEAAGFDEAILLSKNGYLAEGPGENIFLVKDGKLITPGLEADILFGITRFSLLELAESLGIEVQERQIHRDELFTCDEAFFCGTAAEVTPIVNVDGIKVGSGNVGEITKKIQKTFSDAVTGKLPEFRDWLTYV